MVPTEAAAAKAAEEAAVAKAAEEAAYVSDLSGSWYSYARAGDPNHHVDEFDLVRVGGKYKIMRGAHHNECDVFAVHGNTIHHDQYQATIQPNGDIFWPGEQYAARRVAS